MSANSTEVIRSAAAGPWSLALPSGLALLAFAMGLAKSRPFDGPFERECLQRFTEFDAATPPTRRIMPLAIPSSEEVWRAGEHPQRGAARGGHGRRRAALRPDHGPPARHRAGGRPMTVTEVRSPERPTAGDAALVASLKRPRYEIFPLDGVEDEVVRHIPAEVKLTITASPSKGMEPTLKLAERLRRRGYDVVPHLSARLVRDREHLEQVIERLEAADVREVFVIAGDPREAAGEFAGAAGLLSAMDELRGRFAEIGISGYPESHHFISDEATIEAMFEKEPMATYIVSQICFDTGVIDNRRLLRMSLKIGLGESARFLGAHRGWLARLLRPRAYSPTKLLLRLAPTIADPAARIGGLHVYTFNELERTENWRRELVAQLTRDNDE